MLLLGLLKNLDMLFMMIINKNVKKFRKVLNRFVTDRELDIIVLKVMVAKIKEIFT